MNVEEQYVFNNDDYQAQPMRDKPRPTRISMAQLKVYKSQLNAKEEEIYQKIKTAYYSESGCQNTEIYGYYSRSKETMRAIDRLVEIGLIYFDQIQNKWWLHDLDITEENQLCRGCAEFEAAMKRCKVYPMDCIKETK